MNFSKSFIIICFFSILISRFIPHPPNFTSTIAIAFYLPALFGTRYIIVALTAFILSDLIIGIHFLLIFTWASIIIIGLISRYFKNIYFRICGIFSSCIIFYFISNFGVWLLTDIYAENFEGLIMCYIMGLPFLKNSLLGSLFFTAFIEAIISLKSVKNFSHKINPMS